MKIQNLAVIFIIIILPISMILNVYVRNQVKTLSLQVSYDTKLNNATYDALKAFQLNTINSDTSDLSNSKLRDIEASANTFFNSIASNFNMAGYNQDILADYVPALVYTMYDGYYIYSPYTNTLDNTNSNKVIINEATGEMAERSDAQILDAGNIEATYKQGDRITGLKPYIYYSCRYKYGSNDFVITYSLDNYITIQGEINGQWVFDYGYLLDNITVSSSVVKYRGVEIKANETLEEYIGNPDTEKVEKYEYVKVNGVKYYKDNDGKWFSILNGEKYKQENFNPTTTAAIEYYKEAYDFKQRILNTSYTDSNGNSKNDGYGIGNLKASDAVDQQGNQLKDENGNPKFGNYKIFDFGNSSTTSIEDSNSNFNQQRLAVIRYSIEKNLSIAIANYNNYSGVTANFQMPKLKENEWEKIINNVSIISFLQGLNIGGKIYNGYSIITNNKNQEVVSEDAIYILTADNQYHRANDNDLVGNDDISMGVLNIDFERKSITLKGTINYFMPKQSKTIPITGCYTSIVNQTNVTVTDNFYKYMEEKGGKLAQAYFTALGRERYGMYKTNNDPDKLKAKFGVIS